MSRVSSGQVNPGGTEMQVEFTMKSKTQNNCSYGLCFTSSLQASDLYWLTLVVDSDMDV